MTEAALLQLPGLGQAGQAGVQAVSDSCHAWGTRLGGFVLTLSMIYHPGQAWSSLG